MPIMEHAGGDVRPGAAPEMASSPAGRSLTSTKSSAQTTQESNESSSEHACRLEKLALARSKLVQKLQPDPIET